MDGLARLVLHAPGDRTHLVEARAVTRYPAAPSRSYGPRARVPPLAVAASEAVAPGTAVRLWARGWRDARVVGPVRVTYTATDRFHLLDGAVELALDGAGSAGGAAAR
ncbi:hypothetical protein NKH77_37735 [Streptomyces sp. M19]